MNLPTISGKVFNKTDFNECQPDSASSFSQHPIPLPHLHHGLGIIFSRPRQSDMHSPRKELLPRRHSMAESFEHVADPDNYDYDVDFERSDDEKIAHHPHLSHQPLASSHQSRPNDVPSSNHQPLASTAPGPRSRPLSAHQDAYNPQPVVPPQGPNFRSSDSSGSFSQPVFSHPGPPPRSRSLVQMHHPSSLIPSNPMLRLQESGSHHLAFTPSGNHIVNGSPIGHFPSTPFTPAGPVLGRMRESSLPPPKTVEESRLSRSSLSGSAARPRSLSTGGLERAGTLLSHGVGPVRNTHELSRILGKGDSGRKVVGGAKGKGGDVDVRLEAGKRKARVQIDVLLERDIIVEGSDVQGRMEVKVGDWNKKEGDVYVGGGKVRVVGFEDIPSHSSRHIFFHHSHTLPIFTPGSSQITTLFDNTAPALDSPVVTPDEGYRQALAGSHDISFVLPLPITNFPRGPFRTSHGFIKYILIASVKLFFPATGKKSIAHFYRQLTVYPFLDMGIVLRNFQPPIEARKDFQAGSGKAVRLSVKAARTTWVAGQQCWLDVGIRNESSKKIKNLTLSVLQIVTFFHPAPNLAISATADQDAVQTASRRKIVSESVLEVGQSGGRGLITGKGWWKGCEPGQSGSWGCSVQLPPDALSIPRARLIEVSYVVRITINNNHVIELPIKIINFLSIDPPPPLNQRPVSTRTMSSIGSQPSNAIPTAENQPPPVLSAQPVVRPEIHAQLAPAEAMIPNKAKSIGSLQSIQPIGRPLRVVNPSAPSEASTLRGAQPYPAPPVLSHRASIAFIQGRVEAAAAADQNETSNEDETEEVDGDGDEYDDGYFDFSTSAYNSPGPEVSDLVPEGKEDSSLMEPFGYDEIRDPIDDEFEAVPMSEMITSSDIGLAMQNIMLDQSDDSDFESPGLGLDQDADKINHVSKTEDDSDDDDEVLRITPRYPIGPSSPHQVVQNRISSATRLLNSGEESDRTYGSSPPRSSHISSPSVITAASSPLVPTRPPARPMSSYSPSYEEVRQAMHSRRESTTPKALHAPGSAPTTPTTSRSDRLRSALSVPTEPLNIISRETRPRSSLLAGPPSDRSVSPAKSFSSATSSSARPSSPIKSVSKKASFTFASPAAPVRIKVNSTIKPATTARIRPSASLSDLKSRHSPIKVRTPTATLLSTAATLAPSSSRVEKDPEARTGFVPSSRSYKLSPAVASRRSQSAFPVQNAGGDLMNDLPGLASSSSDSGSVSETTPPLVSQDRMTNEDIAILHPSAPVKLAWTAKHLSQTFSIDKSVERPIEIPPVPSMDDHLFIPVDLDALPSRSKTLHKQASSPSVQNKIRQLETRNSALRELTTPASPALRRAATTATRSSTPSPQEEFPSFLQGRPGLHRTETSQTDLSDDAPRSLRDRQATDLRRAPSAVSFKAPMLRHSKSVHTFGQ